MNLREVHLSSRCVIPVALALPINREPADLQYQESQEYPEHQADCARPRREPASHESGEHRRTVSFYL